MRCAYLSNMLYYGSTCIHMYILYGVCSCICTYIDTSAPCHPPADICRPQIGPDFGGFRVFSWISRGVACCNTYLIHIYTSICAAYMYVCMLCMLAATSCHPPSSAGHLHPQTHHGVPPIAHVPHIYTYYTYMYIIWAI